MLLPKPVWAQFSAIAWIWGEKALHKTTLAKKVIWNLVKICHTKVLIVLDVSGSILLLIGQKNTKVFWHQSEARTAATVWNWSGKTLSPGALLAVLYFSSFHIYFSARLDFPLPPLSAPGSPRMFTLRLATFLIGILDLRLPLSNWNGLDLISSGPLWKKERKWKKKWKKI